MPADRKANGQFTEGHEKLGGRVPGTPNAVTSVVRDAILKAFEKIGSEDWLEKLAREDPRTFSTLLSKLVPTEQKLSADDGGPVVVIRDYTGRKPDA
jgi:hypothetical protein